MEHLIGLVAAAILFIGTAGLAIIAAVDGFFSHQMALAGMPPGLQVVVTLVVLAVVLAGVIRLLGGPLMWLVIVLVVLLMLHRTLPGFPDAVHGAPPGASPETPSGPPPAAGDVHV